VADAMAALLVSYGDRAAVDLELLPRRRRRTRVTGAAAEAGQDSDDAAAAAATSFPAFNDLRHLDLRGCFVGGVGPAAVPSASALDLPPVATAPAAAAPTIPSMAPNPPRSPRGLPDSGGEEQDPAEAQKDPSRAPGDGQAEDNTGGDGVDFGSVAAASSVVAGLGPRTDSGRARAWGALSVGYALAEAAVRW
jgi:hypothetical protein